MLAYAPTNRPAARTGSPRALMLVLAGHAALLALVLTARGEIPGGLPFTETEVTFIDPIKPPPPPPPQPDQPRSDTRSRIDTPAPLVPTPQPTPLPLDIGPPFPNPTPFIGNAVEPLPLPFPEPKPLVRKAARFITPADDVRPPSPLSKQRSGEEASLPCLAVRRARPGDVGRSGRRRRSGVPRRRPAPYPEALALCPGDRGRHCHRLAHRRHAAVRARRVGRASGGAGDMARPALS